MNDVTPPNTVWTPDGEAPVKTSGLPSEDTLIEAILDAARRPVRTPRIL